MKNHVFIPKNYKPLLNVQETEQAIKLTKDFFHLAITRYNYNTNHNDYKLLFN